MPVFRKRITEFEALRWFKQGDHPAVESVPEHHMFRTKGIDCEHYGYIRSSPKQSGGHIVKPGDWIIEGVYGFFPMDHDIFEANYEFVRGDEG